MFDIEEFRWFPTEDRGIPRLKNKNRTRKGQCSFQYLVEMGANGEQRFFFVLKERKTNCIERLETERVH